MTEELYKGNLKIPIGISSCLLGERVRYDGGHKGHSYITGTLGNYFEFQPFCPEVAIGLGIPRKPIRLWRNEKKKIEYLIMEASSHGLDQNRLDGLLFDIGIFTNLSHDHLDYHKNMKEYLESKLYLFDRLIKKRGNK